jgi:pimeloyl-ACP methyl ester carboxylesterase
MGNAFQAAARLADRLLSTVAGSIGLRSRFVITRHGRMHVLEADGTGPGPPLLLLHGIGSCAADQVLLARRLLPLTRRLILPDLPGHGRSEAPRRGMDPNLMRDAMLQVAAVVAPEPVIVFGNSLGGMAGIQYALARPDSVLGLMLASPIGAPMTKKELTAFLAGFRMAGHQDALRVLDRVPIRDPVIRRLLAIGAHARMERPAVQDLLQRIRAKHNFRPGALKDLRMPILLFWGADDRVIPSAHRAFFRANLPGHAVIEEPAGYGHVPYLDRPAEFVARMERFLRLVLTP